ncbi:hypothetical protein [Litoribacter populi]|uniref:hypothetical protein n=1 Tax=Litoribacter populi TaxID=2598460 RepID=UPI0011816A9C|nr:hypothetical protein [Litoribacter populi]
MYSTNELQERWNSPTPKFFKRLQKAGLAMVGVGTALLAAPVALPSLIVAIGGYMVTCGSVISVIAQMAKEDAGVLADKNPE